MESLLDSCILTKQTPIVKDRTGEPAFRWWTGGAVLGTETLEATIVNPTFKAKISLNQR